MSWPRPLPAGAFDAFTFYGSWPYWPVPDSSLPALLRRMDHLHIKRAVVLPLRGAFVNAIEANRELAGALAASRDRLLGMAVFDPRRPYSPPHVLSQAKEDGLRGLALYPAHHGYTLGQEPLVDEALWVAEDFGWPAVIPLRLAISWWVPKTDVKSVIECARRHRRVRIVLAGGSYAELDHALRAMGELDNLYIDISGAQSRDFVARAIELGCASQLLFGSGQPIQMPECSLIKLTSPLLTEEDRDAILFENAQRVFLNNRT